MWLRRRALVWLGSLTLVACLSPTLPLPPPEEPTIEELGQGQFLLSGNVPVPGRVSVINLRTGLVDGQATPDRRYSFVIEAEREDRMRMWYVDDNELSQFVEFVIERLLPPPPPGDGGATESGATSDGGP